ncbi:expressed unknown protein [Seminavis robusta]|uniref:Uncharacterized protein n=1 Tax=Seminavis robusta TaxID=568900 RepID=A0A9N8F214_9STRA|nr:expressed unknown protein [Seminavis robusta]|eukprot:Sro3339_g346980.1 n/a (189) ;mRNA; r:5471-6037
MDDPSITINSEELSTSLQINCDLAASTSLTSASSTLSTPYATPKNDRTRNGGGIIIISSSSSSNSNNSDSNAWIAYYEVLKRTPPKAARTGTTAQFHDTLATANKLLELSGESDFRSKPFRDLTHDQQAILVLMILKGMDKIIAGGQQKTAKVLINALRPESMEYKRLSSFVRKGGDCRASVQTLLPN